MTRPAFAFVALGLVAASVTWTAGLGRFDSAAQPRHDRAEVASAGAPAAAYTFADSATPAELAYAHGALSFSSIRRTFADSATAKELAFASAPATPTFADSATPEELTFANEVFAER